MARYIDADKLLERAVPIGWSTPKWVSDIVISDAPTADVVEVVRCKDCIHNPFNTTDDFCPLFVLVRGGYVKHFQSNFFCADGERRDDG